MFLAAQRETPPPHIAQYPFEIVSQRGGIAPICLVFIGYRASIAEILPLRTLSMETVLQMLYDQSLSSACVQKVVLACQARLKPVC